ncbi:MAG: CubicO group peptidase (beta-lactamase class C family), partial [Gammaproteobacteria bacterium]
MNPYEFAASNRPFSTLIKVSTFVGFLLTRALIIFLCALTATAVQASSSINKRSLENTIEKALNSFQTPGMAVGILYQNKVVLSKGFGAANIDAQTPVDAQTYFRLASTSKAFTSAALAILVDEEKIDWNDKVITHLPEFQLYDPYVTR